MAENGRLLVPASERRAMGLPDGGEVVLQVQDGELRVLGLQQAIERAQRLVRQYVPEGVSLVDELIAERRAEAKREREDN